MAQFLDTTGVSYHLQRIITQAQDTLILISPYLKINQRLRQALDDKDRMKIDIRVIYGKNELQPEQINWLRGLQFVRTSFCENLHAKCYLNERAAIITSMNLYEFSQVNNQEMGIYVTKEEDPELYTAIYNEARRLIRISDEIRVSVEKITPSDTQPENTSAEVEREGHCIRCNKSINQSPDTPYCPECYKVWSRYKNPNYQEKHCHICGNENASTINKPVCYACYKQGVPTAQVAERDTKAENASTDVEHDGYCIRCNKAITQDPEMPYCPDCYGVWKRYENLNYKEKYCHICGNENTSTINKPVCYTCYKQNRKLFNSAR